MIVCNSITSNNFNRYHKIMQGLLTILLLNSTPATTKGVTPAAQI